MVKMKSLFDKNKIHNTKISNIVVVVLIFFCIVLLGMASFKLNVGVMQDNFRQVLNVWQNDISDALINSDRMFLNKVSMNLYSLKPEFIKIENQNAVLITYPTESDVLDVCDNIFIKDVYRYSQKVGVVKACFSTERLLLNSLVSPFFLSVVLIIVLFGALLSAMPVMIYRKALLLTIHKLKLFQEGKLDVESYLARIIQDADAQVGVGNVEDELFGLVASGIKKQIEFQKNDMIGKMAAQVAHDIRSPLAALEVASKDLKNVPEQTRMMIKSSVTRINDIANVLLEKNREIRNIVDIKKIRELSDEPRAVELLPCLISSIVSEKRVLCKMKQSMQILFVADTKAYAECVFFVSIQKNEFKRIISNLLNNAIESIDSEIGTVVIDLKLSADNKKVGVVISDNGKGIMPEILAKIGQRGITHGKPNGNGLGLFHAKQTLESWGCDLKIGSVCGKGTTITLTMPLAETPIWFACKIVIQPVSKIVVLDDDISIHQVWDERFASVLTLYKNSNFSIVHLFEPSDLKDHLDGNLFLIDFEYEGVDINGLQAIENYELQKRGHTFLVTSRFEESLIREACICQDVKLLPKAMVGGVDIDVKPRDFTSATLPAEYAVNSGNCVSGTVEYYEYVLIDDDELMRMAWSSVATTKNILAISLSTTSEFFQIRNMVSAKFTKIYVDHDLEGCDVNGYEFVNILHNYGYENLYLTTGYSAEKFPDKPSWLTIIGKSCPF